MSKRLYEAMFLLDSAKGGEELPEAIRYITGLMERNGAEIERVEKWDERKLAYKIQGIDRGIYLQVHCRIEPAEVEGLRNAINLSEEILRVLILKVDEIPAAVGTLYNTDGEEVREVPEEETEED
ncbi:MAG: 30S ribosomal protein S6 [Planctomycetota bacterium]